MPTMKEVKELLSTVTRTDKFTISDHTTNILTKKVEFDIPEQTVYITMYMTPHLTFNFPETMIFDVGSLRLRFTNYTKVYGEVIAVSDLVDDEKDVVLVTLKLKFKEVEQFIIKEDYK